MRNSMKNIKWNRHKFINFRLWVRENTVKIQSQMYYKTHF